MPAAANMPAATSVPDATNVSQANGELADLDAQLRTLRDQLVQAQREARQAHDAGSSILGALESDMAPLRAEISSASNATGSFGAVLDGKDIKVAISEAESEVEHLKLDIEHYREQVHNMQVEERQRVHELNRLKSEVSAATDCLTYEKRRLRHLELCRHLNGQEGAHPLQDASWGGLGQSGIGKRTLEVRAEQRLRETAEQRAGRLSRDVTKLAGDTTQQQAAIARLSQRLSRVRNSLYEKDDQIAGAAKQTAELHSRIIKVVQAADPEKAMALDLADLDALAKEMAKVSDGLDSEMSFSRKEKKKSTKSTGKLPSLSF